MMPDKQMLQKQLRKARQNCDTKEIHRLKRELGLDASDLGHNRNCIILKTD